MKESTQNQAMTNLVYNAVECFISSAYLYERRDTEFEIDQRWHNAYAAECELYAHLRAMSESEKEIYTKFVNWLEYSQLYKSDLTVNKLYSVFKSIK